MKTYDKLIFELSKPGRKGYDLPKDNFATDGMKEIPATLLREKAPELPEVTELDVVRHYTNLSNKTSDVAFPPWQLHHEV